MNIRSTLQKAVTENIISAAQVEPLYRFIQNQQADVSRNGLSDDLSDDVSRTENTDRPLKFVRGFGDVFIALGIVLLVMAINLTDMPGYFYLVPAAGFVALAEWLVRGRRLVLPGMAILVSIIFFVSKSLSFDNENAMTLGFSALSLTSFLFYFRYKMPFSLLPLTFGLLAVVITQIGLDILEIPIVFVGFGVLIFCVALWFDSQDTERKSHLSDNAFWLYLLASPLMVHGVMISLLMNNEMRAGSMNVEILMIFFFVGFFLLSLLIDRRVMLISTQLYMIYALTQLLQQSAGNSQDVMIYILVGLGLFVIYFGAYWYKSRHIIFGFLSGGIISRYIPDLNIQDVKN